MNKIDPKGIQCVPGERSAWREGNKGKRSVIRGGDGSGWELKCIR